MTLRFPEHAMRFLSTVQYVERKFIVRMRWSVFCINLQLAISWTQPTRTILIFWNSTNTQRYCFSQSQPIWTYTTCSCTDIHELNQHHRSYVA